MAIELGVGYLTVLPETSKLAPGIRKGLGESERDSERSGKKSGQGYSKGFKSGIQGMRLGALAAAGGIGALVKSSVNLEKQFSQTMNVTAATLGAPQKELRKLEKMALDLGASTSFSANEVADAMQELAKGGLNTATIQAGALEGTLTLAAAGGTSLASAAGIASNALNTFKIEGKDMASVAAALAGGANASTASVESLGQALGQVGPGAVNAGLNLNETVGALAAFDNAGIKGSDAGTSLKTMLQRLVPQTKRARTAMKEANLDFVDAEGNFVSLTEISQQLQDGLGGLSESARTQALNDIFGSDSSRAASVLMDEGAKGIGRYIKATQDQGAAEAAAQARMKGTAGALERLGGAWETLRLQIGQAVAPAVTFLSDKLGWLMGLLGRHIKTVMIVGAVLGGIAAAILVLNAAIFIATAATTAWGVAVAILTSPITAVVAGIALFVAGLVWLYKNNETARRIMNAAWAGIKTAIGATVDWLVGTAWPFIQKVWSGIQVGARVMWKVLRIIFVSIATAFVLWWKAVKAIWSVTGAPLFRDIAKAATSVWNWLGKYVFPHLQMAFRLMVLGFQTLKNRVWDPVWSGIKTAASAVWGFLKDKVFAPMRSAIKGVGEAFKPVSRVISAAWDKIKAAAAKPINFVIETVYTKGIKATWDKIADAVGLDLELPTISPIKGYDRGGWTGNGSRYTPAGVVHADEFVVSKPSRRRFERKHPGVLDYVNKHGDMPGYAGGGLVEAANWWRTRGARLSEHPLYGGVTAGGHMPGSLHYSGNAVDLNYGPGGTNAAEMAFFDRYMPLFKSLFPSMGTIWRAAGHYNHAHIDTGGHSLGSNSGGGSDGGIGGIITGVIDKIKGLGQRLAAGVGNHPLGKIAGALGRKLIDGIRDKISGLNPLAAAGSAINRGTAGAQVRAAALTRGWGSGAQWDALDWLVNKESGWNPNAANPTSSARGLFQKMTSIHGPVEKTAFGQAKWGLNYIAGRYGNPIKAMQFHQANGYYDKGGLVKPDLFDDGGWMPHKGLGLNMTGKPEAVLTPAESKALKAGVIVASASADGRRYASRGSGASRPAPARQRVTVEIGGREFEGYMREIAEDVVDAEDDYAGTTRRMG